MKRFQPYLKYFKPVKWHFAGSVIAGLVYAAATGAGLPLAAKVVFPLIFDDDGGEDEKSSFFVEALQNWFTGLPDEWLLVAACAWLPLMFLFRAVGGFINTYLISYCGYRFLEQIRDEVFTKLQSLPVAFFQKHQAGDLLARLIGDAEIVRSTVGKVSVDLIKQPAVLIAALWFLLSEAASNKGTSMVLFAILSIPVCILPLRAIAKKLGKKAKSLQASAGDLSGQISESIQAPLEIRAYNMQDAVVAKFRNRVKGIIRYSMKVVKYKLMISPVVEFVSVVGLTVAIYLGAQQGMKLSSFMAIAMALYLCYEPVKKLGAIQGHLKQAGVSLDRLEEISLSVDHLEDPVSPLTPDQFVSRISFDNVTFGYGEEMVVKGVDLTIEPGECLALIGPSGGGKSSLFNLIPRFYDANSGRVSVSGIDVKDWKKSELRDQIAVVSQSAILFQGTIRENILLGRPGASDEEVQAAARKANAHDFILKQKKGYETLVSEMGRSLSGGQRQRIAIARAFLKDAPILLLDEATSALDNESEALIQKELAALVKGRTTLLIAHRLSTTKIASRVIELDQGKIISERAEA
ncbi:ABC transporter ATP-binding protein/permease [Akkermansiaceae bacterium]|nr:ABC transporter ATP-binding protein/permease [Akkermansiaceae bacterium]MDB4464851.1 ABC transporter ATP-binding protein/permease [Akkermansiaceae bacterium]MDB4466332.1 ABC transporter ATP-binding protein/permease [bacterium]